MVVKTERSPYWIVLPCWVHPRMVTSSVLSKISTVRSIIFVCSRRCFRTVWVVFQKRSFCFALSPFTLLSFFFRSRLVMVHSMNFSRFVGSANLFYRCPLEFGIFSEDMITLSAGSSLRRIASRNRLKQLVSISGHNNNNNPSPGGEAPSGVIGRFTVLTDVGGGLTTPDRMRRVSSSSSIASQGKWGSPVDRWATARCARSRAYPPCHLPPLLRPARGLHPFRLRCAALQLDFIFDINFCFSRVPCVHIFAGMKGFLANQVDLRTLLDEHWYEVFVGRW